jgi:Predicted xylanase/chitin deacetylase
MISNGLTVGSHSLTHCELTNIAPEQAAEEIIRSKRELEKKLGVPIRYFCYPCGFLSPALKEIVSTAGYQGACATKPEKYGMGSDVFAIRRIRVSRSADNLFIFWAQVSGYYNLLRAGGGKTE